MRTALVLAAALLARAASAQPGATQPVDPNAPPPAADGSGQQPAAPPTPPGPDQPAPPAAPKGDPAYGDRPDRSIVDPAASDQPGLRRGRDIVVRYTPNRSRENITLLAILAGGGVLFGAVGLYYHFDSRSLSDEVAAKTFSGRAWTPERQDIYDDAHRSSTIATVAYGIGGALLLTTAIVYMATEPAQVETVITPHTNSKPLATVVPTRGGAFVGGTWRF